MLMRCSFGYCAGYSIIITLFFMIVPSKAEAHVKWFISSNGFDKSDVSYFSFLQQDMQLVLGAAILTFISSAIVHICLTRFIQRSGILSQRLSIRIITLAQLLTGSAFFASSINGVLFAPHFFASPNQVFLLMLELVAGILFISRSYVYFASLLTLVIFISISFDYGIVPSFEYLNLIGLIALFSLSYLANTKPNKLKWIESVNSESLIALGLTLYRVSLGIALVTLGLTEKLLHPELALEFMRQNPEFNFMHALGFEFSNRLFVMCGGVAEVLFGAIYIAGFVPRINTVFLAIFLIASNSFFIIKGEVDMALMELIGHLPLLAGAITLVLLGGGYGYSALKPFVSFQWNSLRVNT